MGTSTPLRVVIAGAGGMGRAWMGVVRDAPEAQLVGVADVVDGAAAAAVAEVMPAEQQDSILTGTDATELAQRAGAQAVVDVTIPAAHHPVTADALHAGLPVLGEKPCAATLAEALSLAGHAETTGKLFMVSQSRRNNPHLREAARLAEELGGAGLVQTRFLKAPRFGGFREEMEHPLIVDMAIHAFDAGRVLVAGDPVSVTARSWNPTWSWYGGDAAATVTIEYSTGAVHTYTGSWCSPGAETSWNGEWSIGCPEGTVTWDGDGVPHATAADGTVTAGRAPTDDDRWELDSSLAQFAAALADGSAAETEVHANVWTQAIVEAAVRAADAGRTVLLAEVLDEALAQARELDAADGRSRALDAWETGISGLASGSAEAVRGA